MESKSWFHKMEDKGKERFSFLFGHHFNFYFRMDVLQAYQNWYTVIPKGHDHRELVSMFNELMPDNMKRYDTNKVEITVSHLEIRLHRHVFFSQEN